MIETSTLSADARAILAKIERLSALLEARDMAILEELTAHPGFILIGSEEGEIARTPDELTALFETLFRSPQLFTWDWQSFEAWVERDIAWAFLEGDLVRRSRAGESRNAYRLNAVFQRIGGDWVWRHFFGAEPVR